MFIIIRILDLCLIIGHLSALIYYSIHGLHKTDYGIKKLTETEQQRLLLEPYKSFTFSKSDVKSIKPFLSFLHLKSSIFIQIKSIRYHTWKYILYTIRYISICTRTENIDTLKQLIIKIGQWIKYQHINWSHITNSDQTPLRNWGSSIWCRLWYTSNRMLPICRLNALQVWWRQSKIDRAIYGLKSNFV